MLIYVIKNEDENAPLQSSYRCKIFFFALHFIGIVQCTK